MMRSPARMEDVVLLASLLPLLLLLWSEPRIRLPKYSAWKNGVSAKTGYF